MRFPAALLLLFALLASPGPAQAQAPAGVPLAVDPADQDVDAGARALVNLTITNPLDRVLRVNVTAFEDWASGGPPLSVAVSPSDTLLLPGASLVVGMEVQTSSDSFGRHLFRARVATPDEPGLANETSFSLWVRFPTAQPPPFSPPPSMTPSPPQPTPGPSFGAGPWSFRASLLTPNVTLNAFGGVSFVQFEVENEGDFARLVMRAEDVGGGLGIQADREGSGGSQFFLGRNSTLRPSYGFSTRDPVPGEHLLRVTLSLEEDPSQVQTFDVRVLVEDAPRLRPPDLSFGRDVRVEGPAAPVEVAQGGSARVDYLVTNLGSVGLFVTLDEARVQTSILAGALPAEGFSARWLGERTFLLSAGESRPVQMLVEAPRDAPPGDGLVVTHRLVANDTRLGLGVPGETSLVVTEAAPPAADSLSAMADAVREHPVAFAGLGVGVGALGVAALFRRETWRYAALLGALPLYTRLARSDVLDHKARDALHRLVVAEPGIHYSALKERTGLQTGALVHHLRTLERHRLVTSRREGALRCFYPVGPALPPVEVPLTTPMQARVLALLDAGPLTQKELAARLGLGQQGVSYHVKTLERKGLLAVEVGPEGVARCHRVHDLVVER